MFRSNPIESRRGSQSSETTNSHNSKPPKLRRNSEDIDFSYLNDTSSYHRCLFSSVILLIVLCIGFMVLVSSFVASAVSSEYRDLDSDLGTTISEILHAGNNNNKYGEQLQPPPPPPQQPPQLQLPQNQSLQQQQQPPQPQPQAPQPPQAQQQAPQQRNRHPLPPPRQRVRFIPRPDPLHQQSIAKFLSGTSEDERQNWITDEFKRIRQAATVATNDDDTKKVTIELYTVTNNNENRTVSTSFETLDENSSAFLYYKYVLNETLDDKLKRVSSPLVVDKESIDYDPKNREVIVTTATYSFRNFLYNWMCSIQNLEKENNLSLTGNSGEEKPRSLLDRLIIYTTDHTLAWELVSKRKFFNVHIDWKASRDTNANSPSSLSFNTLAYQRLIMYRTLFINQVLNTYNYTLLLADNDAVWLRDPFPVLKSKEYENYDLVAQNDALPKGANLTCGGFLYLKNTEGMRYVWANITSQFTTLISNTVRPASLNEQEMLPKFDGKQYKIAYLPKSWFPTGKDYFELSREPRLDYPAVHVVHNNFVIGSVKKLVRFQKYNKFLWQVDAFKDYKCEERVMPDLSKITMPPPPPPTPPRNRANNIFSRRT